MESEDRTWCGLILSRVPLPLIRGKAGYTQYLLLANNKEHSSPILEKLQSSWRDKTLQQNRITLSVISLGNECYSISEGIKGVFMRSGI